MPVIAYRLWQLYVSEYSEIITELLMGRLETNLVKDGKLYFQQLLGGNSDAIIHWAKENKFDPSGSFQWTMTI